MEHLETTLRTVVQISSLNELSRRAVEHGIFSGGKRVRPRFLLALVADLTGELTPSAVANAAAVELLHCASLVHDDLPALDNDLLRRGKPTVHAEYGAGVATLAGDIIAMLPFMLAGVRVDLIARGYVQLCDGQVLDLKSSNTIADLLDIHRRKTGALFALAAQLACTGLGNPAVEEAAHAFGELVGVEFQLRNDLADSSEARGSASASDERNERFSAKVKSEIPMVLQQTINQRSQAVQALESLTSRKLEQTKILLTEILRG